MVKLKRIVLSVSGRTRQNVPNTVCPGTGPRHASVSDLVDQHAYVGAGYDPEDDGSEDIG